MKSEAHLNNENTPDIISEKTHCTSFRKARKLIEYCLDKQSLFTTTIMCGLSWNLGDSPSWIPEGLSRPVQRLLYFYYDDHQKPTNVLCVSNAKFLNVRTGGVQTGTLKSTPL